MQEDLGLTAHNFSTLVSLFYVGYIVFQIPGDVFMKKITPPIQLGVALISWGTFTALLVYTLSSLDPVPKLIMTDLPQHTTTLKLLDFGSLLVRGRLFSRQRLSTLRCGINARNLLLEVPGSLVLLH